MVLLFSFLADNTDTNNDGNDNDYVFGLCCIYIDMYNNMCLVLLFIH